MNPDVQMAISAEKMFNNKNQVLVTINEEVFSENIFQKLHKNIKNVYTLQPTIVFKKRFIFELKDNFRINEVKNILSKNCKSEIVISKLNNHNGNFKNIDPYKLIVKNLPCSVTINEVKQLFPLASNIIFIKSNSKLVKPALVSFFNVEDAVLAFKITNQLLFHSCSLNVEFYRNELKSESEESSDSDDDTKWDKIKNACLKNKKVSDSLLIKNFPMDTKGEEILKLYPDCRKYKFIINANESTKAVLIQFKKVEDAIKMYTAANNIFKSNVLHLDFYYKDFDKFLFGETNKKSKYTFENHVRIKTEPNEKNENEQVNSKKVESCVLFVTNLPQTTTNEDLLKLFPKYQQCQIQPEDTFSSAYVSFNSPIDAKKAYNTYNNKMYKERMLTLNFHSKNVKINPFAVLKRKSEELIHEDDNKRNKRDVIEVQLTEPTTNNVEIIEINDEPDNEVIIEPEKQINRVPENHINICEDDVDIKSEDEDYSNDIYVNLTTENEDDIQNEDDVDIEEDIQENGVELDDVLPLDEDDF